MPIKQSNLNPVEQIGIPDAWQSPSNPMKSNESSVRAGLIDLFDTPDLLVVVNKALANNLDIAIAQKQMEEAGLNAGVTRSSYLPEISAKVGSTRSKAATNTISNNYNASLDVSWELDIWGRIRQQNKASKTAFESSEFNLERVRDSIAAQTMQSWFNVLANQHLLENEQQRLESLNAIQKSIKDRYLSGLGTLDDLDAARRNLAQTKSAVSAQKEALAQSKRQLVRLLGEYPHTVSQSLNGRELPRLVPHVPTGIPADILSHRPDLQAAWKDVEAADANTQVNYRSMFPSLSLTGSLGKQSDDFSKLMDSPSIWNISANLTQPLFNAGKLRKQYQISQSQAERAYLGYLNQMLNAFQEVENALGQEQALRIQETALDEALVYAQRTFSNAQANYSLGSINILDLLNTQLAVFDAKNQLINIRNQRLQNRITLGLSLGQGI